MIATGSSNWQLRPSERVIKGNEALLGRKHQLVAMTRIRNEALILATRSTISRTRLTPSSPMTMRAPTTRSTSCASTPRWR